MLENVETFHNCADINKAQPTWAYVIWGSGAQVSSQSEEIADLTISAGFDRVLYFGDLDAKGLEIVTTLRRNLQKRGVEVILEEHLYQLIIGSDLTTEEGGANYAGNFETSWMPNFIVSNLHHLMAIKKGFLRKLLLKRCLINYNGIM
ncbi:MAG: hypothetical protein HZT40_06975 [Candidatus Thiothrix singaporensis]|uniref:Wadjet protein JetD C-terminal domain-containing protein n=1 Tax=Candidatus Thiothrix singaporensis TaxID=2799669 RepID=A0A7L6AYN0_9GAMM|nr:MAG: hypothetical protein HZT40_06975 [Candidatus Thiothrix singaporensis]